MYVDASDLCNELGFNLLEGTSTVTRSWSIKVTQYDCSYNNLAPKGCTQYHFGSTSGLVQTYNWDGGQHLADQDQNICVRYYSRLHLVLFYFVSVFCLEQAHLRCLEFF